MPLCPDFQNLVDLVKKYLAKSKIAPVVLGEVQMLCCLRPDFPLQIHISTDEMGRVEQTQNLREGGRGYCFEHIASVAFTIIFYHVH